MSSDSSSTNVPFTKLPWGPIAGVLVTAIAFVTAQVLAASVFLAALAILGWSTNHINSWLNGVFGQFIVVTCSEVLALGILWLFLRYRRIGWRLLGFRRKVAWKDLGYAVLGFLAYLLIFIVAVAFTKALLHINVDQKQEVGFQDVVGGFQKLLTFISLVLLPPIAEETLFRGFMFGGFRKSLPFIWASLFTSILFALPHLFESSHGLLWIGGIDTFILSLVLCYLREKTDALWAGIVVHMLKNGIAFLALYVFVSK